MQPKSLHAIGNYGFKLVPLTNDHQRGFISLLHIQRRGKSPLLVSKIPNFQFIGNCNWIGREWNHSHPTWPFIWKVSTSCPCSGSAACLFCVGFLFFCFIEPNHVFSNSGMNSYNAVHLFKSHTALESNTDALRNFSSIWWTDVETNNSVAICLID